ncbi:acyltransferase [Halocatena pleomorpha]|uniref:Acyltransferase n=1 Tax=Halocatena pleomorpha TaxID=1785090 RepID=A0A3P3RCD4_9EURY|nr:acyltransferase [Halocatena pleomorpha]RRJ31137.1 acyltransferase [Halocatena pleomorpha]
MSIHETAELEHTTLAQESSVEIREYVTVHDSSIGSDSRIYERVSIKKSDIGDSVDINANTYVENAQVGDHVQIGPNASVVGVTHDLTGEGMEHRNDVFKEIVIEPGAFVGASAVVLPGVQIGENAVVGANVTVTEDVPAGTVLRGTRE